MPTSKYVRNLLPTSFYAQDQWTAGRLTLQGGIRYDHLLTTLSRVEDRRPRLHRCRPAGNRVSLAVDPGDRLARHHAADGCGLRPVRQRQDGRQGEPGQVPWKPSWRATADFDLNPLIRSTISTTRSWTDTNKDFVPDCNLANPGQERRMRRDGESRTSGKNVFSQTFDPGLTTGWGNRPYNWELGASVQQEILPRVSVNVGYFRHWCGNWYAVDNRAITAGGLHSVQHHGADRCAAARRRRPDDQRPVRPQSAQVRAGRRTRAALGATSGSRSRTGRASMSTSTRGCGTGSRCRAARAPGARSTDNCALKAALPEQGANANGSIPGSPETPWSIPIARSSSRTRRGSRGSRRIRSPGSTSR